MKLLYEVKEREKLPISVGEQLLLDIDKLPMFKLVYPPITFRNWKSRRFVVDEWGNLIALVSNEYRLTQPKEILFKFAELIKDKVTGYEIYYYNGAFTCKFRLKDIVEFGDDKLKLGLLYIDSVNALKRLRITFAPTLLSCMNDLIVKKHTLASRHVRLITSNVKRFLAMFKTWLYDLSIIKQMKESMMNTKLSFENFKEIIKDLDIPLRYYENIKWCNGYTLWDLYMDLTRNLTRLNAPLQYHLRVAKLGGI
ncbi:MAG: hypothetical protein QXK51_11555 [Candidatus Methanomethylicia archaeon]